MTTTPDPATVFLDRSRYYLGTEFPTKMRRAVEALPPEALWWRPNEQSNSIGNLLLHLSGNVRQWIVGGVGGVPNTRDRAAEFAAQGGMTSAELMAALDGVLAEVDGILAKLSAADLLERRIIQGRHLSVLEAIYHVVEHFAMHLGQIILLVKVQAPGSIRFYEDVGGLARPIWNEAPSKKSSHAGSASAGVPGDESGSQQLDA
jgi:uncharacterized damage-inducible protein DinB